MLTTLRTSALIVLAAAFAWGCSSESNPVSGPVAADNGNSKFGAQIAETDPSNSDTGVDVIDADQLVGAWALRMLSNGEKTYNGAVALLTLRDSGNGSWWTPAERGWERTDFAWSVERNLISIAQETGARATLIANLQGNGLELRTPRMMIDPSGLDRPDPLQVENAPAWDSAMLQRLSNDTDDGAVDVDNVQAEDLLGAWRVRSAWVYGQELEIPASGVIFRPEGVMETRAQVEGRIQSATYSWQLDGDKLGVRDASGEIKSVRVVQLGGAVFMLSGANFNDPTGIGSRDDIYIPGTKWHVARMVPTQVRDER